MCIIIDANVAHEVIGSPTDAGRRVYVWLVDEAGIVATGGRSRTELLKTRFREIYQTLLLAGKLYRYSDEEVDETEIAVSQTGRLISDDPHVIALALVSRCRLLFSRDQNLHEDFRNPLVLKPRGHIYQDADHNHLLREATSCRSP